MGPNSHQDLCNLWVKVHRTFFNEGRRNRSGKISFPILDILNRSGDIRDQSRRLYKIDRNFACSWPQIFWGRAPRIFGPALFNPASFRSCGKVFRRSAEGPRRTRGERKKKRKTSRAFYKSSRTTVTGGLIKHKPIPWNYRSGRPNKKPTTLTKTMSE